MKMFRSLKRVVPVLALASTLTLCGCLELVCVGIEMGIQAGINGARKEQRRTQRLKAQGQSEAANSVTQVKKEYEFKNGDVVFVEFYTQQHFGWNRIVTITRFNDQILSGYFEYNDLGATTTAIFDRSEIKTIKLIKKANPP